MGPRRRWLLLILTAATLRFGAVGVMDVMDARPAPEERSALDRAAAALDPTDPAPLYPRLLSLVSDDRDPVAAARLVGVMLGVVATALVLRFSRRIVHRRAAWAAAWIYALHPTALFFGVAVRVETLGVVLSLLAVDLALAARGAPPGMPRLGRAVLCGAALGLLVAASPMWTLWLVGIPLAMMGPLRCWAGRRTAAAVIVLSALASLMPWGGGVRGAFGELPSTIVEGLSGLRLVWAADLAPTRHAAAVFHQPVPWWAGAGRWVIQMVLWLALTSLVIKGLLRREAVTHPRFLLLLAAAGSVGAALAGLGPEGHHGLLVLLLPAAGAGWVMRKEPLPASRQLRAAILMGAVAWLSTSSLDEVIEHRLLASSASMHWVDPVARAAGAHPVYRDLVEIRLTEGAPVLMVEPSPDHPPLRIESPTSEPTLATVHGGDPHRRGHLVMRRSGSTTDIIVQPVAPDSWNRWRSLADHGLQGVEIRWLGGVGRQEGS